MKIDLRNITKMLNPVYYPAFKFKGTVLLYICPVITSFILTFLFNCKLPTTSFLGKTEMNLLSAYTVQSDGA
jgi:hypothetical protein